MRITSSSSEDMSRSEDGIVSGTETGVVEPTFHAGEAAGPFLGAGQTVEKGFLRRDVGGLTINDGVHGRVAHGAAPEIPPAVDVELHEIRIG